MSGYFNTADWGATVDELRTKAARFIRVYDAVVNTHSDIKDNPDMIQEYNSIINKGDFIKGTIQRISSGIDNISGSGGNVLNAIGLNYDTITRGNNLGFILPLVPIAVILSASAGITYWVTDALKYLDKVRRVKELTVQVGSKKAYNMVYGTNMKNIVPWVIGGISIVFLAPKIKQLFKVK